MDAGWIICGVWISANIILIPLGQFLLNKNIDKHEAKCAKAKAEHRKQAEKYFKKKEKQRIQLGLK